jgi:hypothetical protein
LWNETRAAGLHCFIQPLSSLDSIDFIKRVFRKGGDVETLPCAGRGSTISLIPRQIVLRAIPVIRETKLTPPRP